MATPKNAGNPVRLINPFWRIKRVHWQNLRGLPVVSKEKVNPSARDHYSGGRNDSEGHFIPWESDEQYCQYLVSRMLAIHLYDDLVNFKQPEALPQDETTILLRADFNGSFFETPYTPATHINEQFADATLTITNGLQGIADLLGVTDIHDVGTVEFWNDSIQNPPGSNPALGTNLETNVFAVLYYPG